MRQGIREDRERVLGVTQKKARTERNSSDTFANNAINTTNNEYNCVSMKGFCVWKQKKISLSESTAGKEWWVQ